MKFGGYSLTIYVRVGYEKWGPLIIWVEILKNLEMFQEFFNDREIVICREMTKLHEEFIRLKVSNLNNLNLNIKGELTIIFSEKKTWTFEILYT